MQNVIETSCSICARNGIIRNNCTIVKVINDLEELVTNGDMSIDNESVTSQLENTLNNIKEHINMGNESVLALLAYLIRNKKNLQNVKKYNKDIQISLLEIDNVKETSSTTFCGVCLEDVKFDKTASFDCNHSFCGECVINNLVHTKNKYPLKCYVCRVKVNIINIYDDKNIYNGLKEQLSL